jgi:hypothetical protein
MIGISKELAAKYPAEQLAVWFGYHAHLGEVRVRYARSKTDSNTLTSWLPSSRHMDYVAKGWTAVDIDAESVPKR